MEKMCFALITFCIIAQNCVNRFCAANFCAITQRQVLYTTHLLNCTVSSERDACYRKLQREEEEVEIV